MPSSSLVEVRVEVEVWVEVEVGVWVGIEVEVGVEVGVILLFRMGRWVDGVEWLEKS